VWATSLCQIVNHDRAERKIIRGQILLERIRPEKEELGLKKDVPEAVVGVRNTRT